MLPPRYRRPDEDEYDPDDLAGEHSGVWSAVDAAGRRHRVTRGEQAVQRALRSLSSPPSDRMHKAESPGHSRPVSRASEHDDAHMGWALRLTFRPVKIAREHVRLTQQQLADRAGISVRTLRRLERDACWPSVETVSRIAVALGMSDPRDMAALWRAVAVDAG